MPSEIAEKSGVPTSPSAVGNSAWSPAEPPPQTATWNHFKIADRRPSSQGSKTTSRDDDDAIREFKRAAVRTVVANEGYYGCKCYLASFSTPLMGRIFNSLLERAQVRAAAVPAHRCCTCHHGDSVNVDVPASVSAHGRWRPPNPIPLRGRLLTESAHQVLGRAHQCHETDITSRGVVYQQRSGHVRHRALGCFLEYLGPGPARMAKYQSRRGGIRLRRCQCDTRQQSMDCRCRCVRWFRFQNTAHTWCLQSKITQQTASPSRARTVTLHMTLAARSQSITRR